MTNMKRMRVNAGLTLKDIADKLGTDSSFIGRLERREYKRTLRESTRMKIEALFGESIKYLLQEAPKGTMLLGGLPKECSDVQTYVSHKDRYVQNSSGITD